MNEERTAKRSENRWLVVASEGRERLLHICGMTQQRESKVSER